jgi:hypothetical protein
MATEIYIRKPLKTNIHGDAVETNDELEIFLQQIEMTLSTRQTSVLGATDYGISLDYYLHTLNTNENELKDLISNQIKTYCTLEGKFSYKIDVEIFELETSNALVVDITVESDNLVRIVVE